MKLFKNKHWFLVSVICFLFFGVAGCSSGVSQEIYESVVSERDALKEELESLKDANQETILETQTKYETEEQQDSETELSCFLYTNSGDGKAYLSGYTGSYGELVLPESMDGAEIVGISDDMSGVFAVHDELVSVVIPEGYEYIGSSAFRSCENLSKVEIPSTVKTIRHGAFVFCNSLNEIYIPSTVTSIDEGVFTDEKIVDIDGTVLAEMPTLICEPGSYAEEYAKEYGYEIKYKD